MRAAVVVLPLVPVTTMLPSVNERESLVRIFGSIQRETSPGSVVPPPRRNPRLNEAVNLPAQSAAVPRAPSWPRIRRRPEPDGTATPGTPVRAPHRAPAPHPADDQTGQTIRPLSHSS